MDSYKNLVLAAKVMIDDVALYGHNYKHNDRCARIGVASCLMSPCITFSALGRLLLCPFQCICNDKVFCNPIYSMLIGSCITDNSDKFLIRVYSDINRKNVLGYCFNEKCAKEIILYAAEKIRNSTKTGTKYAIADCVSQLMNIVSNVINSTPHDVLKYADGCMETST